VDFSWGDHGKPFAGGEEDSPDLSLIAISSLQSIRRIGIIGICNSAKG